MVRGIVKCTPGQVRVDTRSRSETTMSRSITAFLKDIRNTHTLFLLCGRDYKTQKEWIKYHYNDVVTMSDVAFLWHLMSLYSPKWVKEGKGGESREHIGTEKRDSRKQQVK